MNITQKEKEISNYMEKLHISREEATQLWEDDNSDEVLPEVKEIEKKANKLKRHYEKSEKSTTKKATKPREKKIDSTKAKIITILANALNTAIIPNEITNVDREISFDFEGSNYSIVLTKHKNKKS